MTTYYSINKYFMSVKIWPVADHECLMVDAGAVNNDQCCILLRSHQQVIVLILADIAGGAAWSSG
jgi:hypothetical protein